MHGVYHSKNLSYFYSLVAMNSVNCHLLYKYIYRFLCPLNFFIFLTFNRNNYFQILNTNIFLSCWKNYFKNVKKQTIIRLESKAENKSEMSVNKHYFD